MQLYWPRLAEEAIPDFGSKSDDTGEASFEVTKFDCADQRSEVPTERTQRGAILRAGIECRDQEDRGAG